MKDEYDVFLLVTQAYSDKVKKKKILKDVELICHELGTKKISESPVRTRTPACSECRSYALPTELQRIRWRATPFNRFDVHMCQTSYDCFSVSVNNCLIAHFTRENDACVRIYPGVTKEKNTHTVHVCSRSANVSFPNLFNTTLL